MQSPLCHSVYLYISRQSKISSINTPLHYHQIQSWFTIKIYVSYELYILKIALNLFVTSWANVGKNRNLKSQFVVQVELNKKREINFMGNEKLSTNGNSA